MKTTRFLINILKRHQSFEVAQKVSLLELSLVRSKEDEFNEKLKEVRGELDKIIAENNIVSDEIL